MRSTAMPREPKRFVARVMAIAATVVACGGLLAACSQQVPAKLAAGAPITVRLELPRTSMAAGSVLRGTVVLVVPGTSALWIRNCQADGWFGVGLTDAAAETNPGSGLVACAVRIPPGVHRFPVEIGATYTACGGEPGSKDDPPCSLGPRHVPPLPAGIYQLSLDTYGMPTTTKVTLPPSITVVG